MSQVTPTDDIPGVTRRHRPADFYHERTNFQFIKHSRRWAILSGTWIVAFSIEIDGLGINRKLIGRNSEIGAGLDDDLAFEILRHFRLGAPEYLGADLLPERSSAR